MPHVAGETYPKLFDQRSMSKPKIAIRHWTQGKSNIPRDTSCETACYISSVLHGAMQILADCVFQNAYNTSPIPRALDTAPVEWWHLHPLSLELCDCFKWQSMAEAIICVFRV